MESAREEVKSYDWVETKLKEKVKVEFEDKSLTISEVALLAITGRQTLIKFRPAWRIG